VTSATPDVILEKYLKGDISHARQQFLLHILMATPVSFHTFHSISSRQQRYFILTYLWTSATGII
jgi:hypothetical protein